MWNFYRYIRCSVISAVSSIGLAPLSEAQIALEPEFVDNQTTAGDQFTTFDSDFLSRSVGELSNGSRIVSYFNSPGSTHRVAIISSSVAPVTGIDLGAASSQLATVAALTTGGFVVVYSDNAECLIELFNNAGVPQVGPVNVALAPVSPKSECSVAPLRGSDFIVFWRDRTIDGFGDIYARRFNNGGGDEAAGILVDDAAGVQKCPNVAPRAVGGGFVITWDDCAGMAG